MDSVKADVDLIQTEWDVCSRELQAARERVSTQSRVNTLSAELADLDRSLGEQDQWLEGRGSAIPKCNDETELIGQIRECEVRLLSLLKTYFCLNVQKMFMNAVEVPCVILCRWSEVFSVLLLFCFWIILKGNL